MNHDPEQLAAAYLATMRPRAGRRFEAHLLACERCWQEVSLGCRGRQLAQAARAPSGPPSPPRQLPWQCSQVPPSWRGHGPTAGRRLQLPSPP